MTRRTIRRMVVVLLAVAMVASCSSMKGPPNTVSAQFFRNPDLVWACLQETLDTLGYEVESSNRYDGVIRAVGHSPGGSPGVALRIDQVMRTLDQVNVYVKPQAADPDNPPGEKALVKAARDFVTVLERKLK